MNAATSFDGGGGGLPKRFALLPTHGDGLQVVVAAQCVGYVWSDRERWRANARGGEVLELGPAATLYEAVSAVFARQREQRVLKAQ